MKKKIVTMLLAMVMALSVTACGEKEVVSTNYDDIEEGDKDKDKDTEKNETKETQEETKVDENVPEVRLGVEFDEEYEGYEYLYCEMLMTESEENPETGKMESQKIYVFIPNGDYSSVNRDTAYADCLGVNFRVSLNPYIRYNAEDYLPEENLAKFLEDEYDAFYSTQYRDLVVSDVESTGDGVRATANYCYYDEWNNQFIPIYCTYYLVELSKDVTVLVEVEIDSEEVTGKTPALLAELESFYGFDIDWDKDAAQKKLEAFLASGEADVNEISTGFLICELPEGWKQDYGYGDYSVYAYAPDGDVDAAGCVITFNYEYMGLDSFDVAEELQTQEDIDSYTAYLKETLGEKVKDIEVSYCGETNLGNTMKISYKTVDGDYEDSTCVYMATRGDYVYTMQTIALPDCGYDMDAIAQNVLDNCTVRE